VPESTVSLRRRLDTGIDGLFGPEPPTAWRLEPSAREVMIAYLELLRRWNRSFNLTAVRDPLEMVPRHLLDSLAVLPYLTAGPVLDAGTGAGLPGIPLAIARPDLAFTLLDANGKKTRFVRQAVLTLGLPNVDVVQDRLETYRPAQKFATIVTRALAATADLVRVTRHLCADGGNLLAMKGRTADEETAALDHAAVDAVVHRLSVPFLDGKRTLIEIRCEPSQHG
jgi:16S rRNA (guanine527-N7)-methyltransferase